MPHWREMKCMINLNFPINYLTPVVEVCKATVKESAWRVKVLISRKVACIFRSVVLRELPLLCFLRITAACLTEITLKAIKL